MIIRALFTKKNYLRYLSHLDLVRLFHRSFNRCQIPIKYSEGFNPHPRFSIANPLSLGIESEGEFIDIDLTEEIPIEDFITKMNQSLPEDIQITKAVYLKKDVSISSIIEWSYYEIRFQMLENLELEQLLDKIHIWLENDEILITRQRKKGRNKITVEENIRSLIGNVVVKNRDSENFFEINALLKSGESVTLRPMDFVQAMDRDLNLKIDLDLVYLKRLELLADDGNEIYSPL